MIGPLVALSLVVVAYTFVPGLSSASRSEGGLQNRLQNSVKLLNQDVTRQINKTREEVNSRKRDIERDFPGQLKKARNAVKGAQERVEKAVEGFGARRNEAPSDSPTPNPDSAKEGY